MDNWNREIDKIHDARERAEAKRWEWEDVIDEIEERERAEAMYWEDEIDRELEGRE